MKKKGFLVLLFALICLVSVGCGKDDDDDKKSSKKSNERTLKCTTEEDSGKMIVNISQDKKSYEFTKGSVSMTMDISSYGEAAKGMDWESMFCESFKDEMPSKTCKAAVDGNNLSIDIELDMEKYAKQLKEDGDITDINEKSLDELKESAEKDGATCTLS